jgi:hypothetical protein
MRSKTLQSACFILAAGVLAPFIAHAQAPAPAPAANTAHYSVENTDIGTLLDDPAAKTVIDKHMPGFSTRNGIDMARSMTLKSVQQYAGDTMSDKVLADIQADFNKLPAKK